MSEPQAQHEAPGEAPLKAVDVTIVVPVQRRDAEVREVVQALGGMDRGKFGLCRRCHDPIGYARLSARPESPYCLDCQHEIDRKHG